MIYIVRLGDYLKIGYSSNVGNRMKGLMTSCLNVELISTREGDRYHEKKIHELCSEYKIRNELFKDDPMVIELFKNHIFSEDQKKYDQLLSKYNELVSEANYMKNIINGGLSKKDKDNVKKPNGLKEQEYNDKHKWIDKLLFCIKDGYIEKQIPFFFNEKYIKIGELLHYNIEKEIMLNYKFELAKKYTTKENIDIYYYDTDKSIDQDIVNKIVNKVKSDLNKRLFE